VDNPGAAALDLYVVTTPGLEALTRAELEALGVRPTGGEPGGISFQGSLDDVARANLWLRTASRVLVRITAFHARALGELERKAAAITWRAWLVPRLPVRLRVSCRKSRLYHQKAVAERIERSLQAAGWEVVAGSTEPGEEVEESSAGGRPAEAQLLIVRIFRDECTISLDSSGELLHRRAYRLAGGKAPLRETLAAGLILASGWSPATPLLDPFAGSGTIPIEAALIARRLPPGRHRRFAFHRWPSFDPDRWTSLLDAADDQSLVRAPAPILASDRDAGAVTAATANAGRAGVGGDISIRKAAVSALAPPEGRGALIANPPYGVRVGDQRELRDLYARLGQVARKQLPGWRLTLLVPAFPLERQTGLKWTELFSAKNGGLSVRAVSTIVEPATP
jgi:putative N6-adenine-specific DNA methylase